MCPDKVGCPSSSIPSLQLVRISGQKKNQFRFGGGGGTSQIGFQNVSQQPPHQNQQQKTTTLPQHQQPATTSSEILLGMGPPQQGLANQSNSIITKTGLTPPTQKSATHLHHQAATLFQNHPKINLTQPLQECLEHSQEFTYLTSKQGHNSKNTISHAAASTSIELMNMNRERLVNELEIRRQKCELFEIKYEKIKIEKEQLENKNKQILDDYIKNMKKVEQSVINEKKNVQRSQVEVQKIKMFNSKLKKQAEEIIMEWKNRFLFEKFLLGVELQRSNNQQGQLTTRITELQDLNYSLREALTKMREAEYKKDSMRMACEEERNQAEKKEKMELNRVIESLEATLKQKSEENEVLSKAVEQQNQQIVELSQKNEAYNAQLDDFKGRMRDRLEDEILRRDGHIQNLKQIITQQKEEIIRATSTSCSKSLEGATKLDDGSLKTSIDAQATNRFLEGLSSKKALNDSVVFVLLRQLYQNIKHVFSVIASSIKIQSREVDKLASTYLKINRMLKRDVAQLSYNNLMALQDLTLGGLNILKSIEMGPSSRVSVSNVKDEESLDITYNSKSDFEHTVSHSPRSFYKDLESLDSKCIKNSDFGILQNNNPMAKATLTTTDEGSITVGNNIFDACSSEKHNSTNPCSELTEESQNAYCYPQDGAQAPGRGVGYPGVPHHDFGGQDNGDAFFYQNHPEVEEEVIEVDNRLREMSTDHREGHSAAMTPFQDIYETDDLMDTYRPDIILTDPENPGEPHLQTSQIKTRLQSKKKSFQSNQNAEGDQLNTSFKEEHPTVIDYDLGIQALTRTDGTYPLREGAQFTNLISEGEGLKSQIDQNRKTANNQLRGYHPQQQEQQHHHLRVPLQPHHPSNKSHKNTSRNTSNRAVAPSAILQESSVNYNIYPMNLDNSHPMVSNTTPSGMGRQDESYMLQRANLSNLNNRSYLLAENRNPNHPPFQEIGRESGSRNTTLRKRSKKNRKNKVMTDISLCFLETDADKKPTAEKQLLRQNHELYADRGGSSQKNSGLPGRIINSSEVFGAMETQETETREQDLHPGDHHNAHNSKTKRSINLMKPVAAGGHETNYSTGSQYNTQGDNLLHINNKELLGEVPTKRGQGVSVARDGYNKKRGAGNGMAKFLEEESMELGAGKTGVLNVKTRSRPASIASSKPIFRIYLDSNFIRRGIQHLFELRRSSKRGRSLPGLQRLWSFLRPEGSCSSFEGAEEPCKAFPTKRHQRWRSLLCGG